MTEQEMWRAVRSNDAGCDGLFFYAVNTTGIYCRPSCRSKVPKRENVCFFATAEAARAAGFRPCKRCRSDLTDYQPMRDIARDAKDKLDAAFAAQTSAGRALVDVGLTPRRLTDIFKAVYGVTPKEYTDALRLAQVQTLLTTRKSRIIDIAYATGFCSLSTFNRFFKQRTGLTPGAYRREQACSTFIPTHRP